MTDFLSRLAQRQIDPVSPIRPRATSMYATPVPAMGAEGGPQTAPPELAFSAVSSETIAAPAMAPRNRRETRAEPAANNKAPRSPPAIGPPREDKGVAGGAPFRPLVKTQAAVEASGPTVSTQPAGLTAPSSSRADLFPRPAIRAMATPLDHTAIPIESPGTRQEPHDSARTEPLSAPPSLLARPSSQPVAVQGSDAAEPEVHVTIGRIEVTAVHAPPSPKRAPAPGKKPMSLDEYLAKRSGGRK